MALATTNMAGQPAFAALPHVRLDRLGHVGVITLDNPPVNAIGDGVLGAIDKALDNILTDDDVRVLVLRGHGGRAFSAGSDVKEFPLYLADGTFVSDKLTRENRVFTRIANWPVPTLAVIEGVALGGGLELAVCCDLVVASATARFALPEIALGGFPGSGGVFRIPRRIGHARAARMMFLGQLIDAHTALNWGLIDEIADEGEAFDSALHLAQAIAARPPLAVRACKAALVAAQQRGLDDQMLAHSLASSAIIAASADFAEGVAAFVAKRPARFPSSAGSASAPRPSQSQPQ